jgi:hypothetical protein
LRDYRLKNEIDAILSHLLTGATVALDVPERQAARLTLFQTVRERGDALYGPGGYRTALVGPRLVVTRTAESAL